MPRIGLRRSEPFDIDLWDGQGGGLYVCAPATKSVNDKGTPLLAEFNTAVAADEHDQAVEIMGQILDLRLSPVAGKTKASTLVKRQWDADKVTVDELIALFEDIQEASRPT